MEGAELAEFAGFFGLGAASGALGSAFFTAFGAAGGAGAGFEGFFAGAVLGSSFLASGRFFVLIGVDLAVFLVFAADLKSGVHESLWTLQGVCLTLNTDT